MVEISTGWNFQIERGPDWLFVKLRSPNLPDDHSAPLAEVLWSILEQHFTYRVVLELEDLNFLQSYVVGQLVMLQKRVHAHGGVLRVCGLSEMNRKVLESCHLNQCFPNFADREDAVMHPRPMAVR